MSVPKTAQGAWKKPFVTPPSVDEELAKQAAVAAMNADQRQYAAEAYKLIEASKQANFTFDKGNLNKLINRLEGSIAKVEVAKLDRSVPEENEQRMAYWEISRLIVQLSTIFTYGESADPGALLDEMMYNNVDVSNLVAFLKAFPDFILDVMRHLLAKGDVDDFHELFPVEFITSQPALMKVIYGMASPRMADKLREVWQADGFVYEGLVKNSVDRKKLINSDSYRKKIVSLTSLAFCIVAGLAKQTVLK